MKKEPAKKAKSDKHDVMPASTPEPEAVSDEVKGMLPPFNKRLLLTSGVVAVAVVLMITAITLGGDDTDATADQTLTQEEAQQEVEELLEKVSKHILLPENEIPLVATVIDASALAAEQPFYSGVQDDDRLIIYGESLKAIIYSPERDIVVNVGPVQFAPPVEGELPPGTQ